MTYAGNGDLPNFLHNVGFSIIMPGQKQPFESLPSDNMLTQRMTQCMNSAVMISTCRS